MIDLIGFKILVMYLSIIAVNLPLIGIVLIWMEYRPYSRLIIKLDSWIDKKLLRVQP